MAVMAPAKTRCGEDGERLLAWASILDMTTSHHASSCIRPFDMAAVPQRTLNWLYSVLTRVRSEFQFSPA
jgi:hypothetical protein